jgi:hypothetical protein
VLIKDMFIMVLSQWKNAESQQLCMQYWSSDYWRYEANLVSVLITEITLSTIFLIMQFILFKENGHQSFSPYSSLLNIY